MKSKKLKEKEKTDDIEYAKRLTNIDLLTKEQKYEIFKRFLDKNKLISI